MEQAGNCLVNLVKHATLREFQKRARGEKSENNGVEFLSIVSHANFTPDFRVNFRKSAKVYVCGLTVNRFKNSLSSSQPSKCES